MTSPFPLFRLPRVVLTNVFNMTNPNEIIKISLCSKKAAWIIKYTPNQWKRNKNLELVFQKTRLSTVRYGDWTLMSATGFSGYNFLEPLTNLKTGDFVVPVNISSMVTYWENILMGLNFILDHSMGIFNSEVSHFEISKDATPSELYWIFHWMASRKTVFSSCVFNYSEVDPEDLNFFFQNIQFNSFVTLTGSPPENFTNEPNTFLSHPTKFVEILDGFWLKKSDILNMNCGAMILTNAPLFSEDMNDFLRKWQLGETGTSLKFAVFNFSHAVNLAEYVEGLDVVEVPVGIQREYKICAHEFFEIEGGFNITRHDGVVATLCKEKDVQETEPVVKMVVWPDWISGGSVLDPKI